MNRLNDYILDEIGTGTREPGYKRKFKLMLISFMAVSNRQRCLANEFI